MLARTIDILDRLIACPTVSSDSNLELIADLSDTLSHLGARVITQLSPCGTKANLFASLGPDRPGGVLLSGHTDVVPVTDQDWASDPFIMRTDDGRLYGRGTCDMKGFIAAAMAMAEGLDPNRLTRPLHFAFTYDEETGCLGARHLVGELRGLGITPDIVIIGEPTDMRIIEGHKGCYEYSTHFTGLEGHGSRPELGVNAAEYAVRYVARLLDLRVVLKTRTPPDSLFEPPWSTINIGRVAGGAAHNVVVGKAEIDWEMRPVRTEDADLVKADLERYCTDVLLPAMQAVHPDASITTTTVGEVEGLIPMPQNAARDLVAELTGANGCELVSFGTEAGLFQSLGCDVVVCGPGSILQAHKPDEFIELSQLEQCCTMLDRMADKLGR